MPLVNHEATYLVAIAYASQHGLLRDYVVALGYGVVGLEHSTPHAMMTTVRHADPSDPVFAYILLSAYV